MTLHLGATSQEIKSCCAATYGSDWARLLIGDSMHPGGLGLTERIGHLLGLGPGSHVLDVAAGRGASAVALAQRFGCDVTGVDLSPACAEAASYAANTSGLGGRLRFVTGDAENLPFEDRQFGALICECAFCTFPDKVRAAAEMARVLEPGGRLGLSDLVLRGELPPQLQTLAGWVACVADARAESEYIGHLDSAGLTVLKVENQDQALISLITRICHRLLGATLLSRLRNFELPGADLSQATVIARAAESAVRSGVLGYVLVMAAKPVAGEPQNQE